MSSNIALFIDAENVSHRYFSSIINETEKHGMLLLKVIYGDWEREDMQSWHRLATQHDFKIRHQTNAINAKNASDILLIMDAIEVLYRLPIHTFCLVTNDADFVPLCHKLREAKKKQVIGVGYAHAGVRLIRACNQFIFIGQSEDNLTTLASEDIISTDNLRRLVEKAFLYSSAKYNWITMAELGVAIRKINPNFDVKKQGYPNLTRLIYDIPDLVAIRTDGTQSIVRLKYNSERNRLHLDQLLKKAFDKAEVHEDGWVTFSDLGNALREVEGNFTVKAYGYKNLTSMLEDAGEILEIRGSGATLEARWIG